MTHAQLVCYFRHRITGPDEAYQLVIINFFAWHWNLHGTCGTFFDRQPPQFILADIVPHSDFSLPNGKEKGRPEEAIETATGSGKEQ